VLKKAGIVVATAAVGLLAVSPLAFASEGHGKGGHDDAKDVDVASSSIQKDSQNSQGLLNAVNGNNVQICSIDVAKLENTELLGAVALLGFADDSDTVDSSRNCNQGDVSAAHEG
jgi:hypothetical protein